MALADCFERLTYVIFLEEAVTVIIIYVNACKYFANIWQ